MARAHFVTYLTDSQGNIISGATVNVYEPDTETLISETIYAEDDPGGTTKTNPFTADADGKCEIWLENPKIVDLKVTKTGYNPLTLRATAHQLTASTLTLKEAGTPLAQRAGVNFLTGFDLADDAGSDETEVSLDLLEVTDFTDHSARHENGGADEISLAGLDGESTELASHKADAADAHDASAISVLDSGGNFTATDVEAALAEEADARQAHEADGTDAHDASAISIVDSGGNYAATNVETALAEVMDAEQAHEADAADAHDASAISIADAGGDFDATTVEGALDELQADNEAHSADADAHHTQVHTAADHSDVQRVLKTANESVVSSTTVQADDDLTFSVESGKRYEYEIVLFIDGATGGDFKWELSVPGTPTCWNQVNKLSPSGTAVGDDDFSVVDQGGNLAGTLGAGTETAVHIRGIIFGHSSGNVTLFWAQNTSSGTATRVLAGSFLIAREI